MGGGGGFKRVNRRSCRWWWWWWGGGVEESGDEGERKWCAYRAKQAVVGSYSCETRCRAQVSSLTLSLAVL